MHTHVEVRGQLAGLGLFFHSVEPGIKFRLSGFGGRHFYLVVSSWVLFSPSVDVAWCFVIIPRSEAVFIFSG